MTRPIRIIPADQLAAALGITRAALSARASTAEARLLRGYTPRDARKIANAPKRGRPRGKRRQPKPSS